MMKKHDSVGSVGYTHTNAGGGGVHREYLVVVKSAVTREAFGRRHRAEPLRSCVFAVCFFT